MADPLRGIRAGLTPGPVALGYALICVLCLGIVSPFAIAKAAPGPLPKRQQGGVLFLSSLDPDLPDVATMIEQTKIRILECSDMPVHFSFEYLGSSSFFKDPSCQRATASYLLENCRGQSFDISLRGLLRPRVVSAALARELVVIVSKPGLSMNTAPHNGRRCV